VVTLPSWTDGLTYQEQYNALRNHLCFHHGIDPDKSGSDVSRACFLPYEGAYAQALYLLDHGFQPKPTHDESQLITDHNRRFEEPNDCEEAILTFLKLPDTLDNAESLSAGDIMRELSFRGFRGREYNAISIGRCMKRLGFETKKIRGVIKYLVTKVDPDLHNRENKEDAKEFVPEVF